MRRMLQAPVAAGLATVLGPRAVLRQDEAPKKPAGRTVNVDQAVSGGRSRGGDDGDRIRYMIIEYI